MKKFKIVGQMAGLSVSSIMEDTCQYMLGRADMATIGRIEMVKNISTSLGYDKTLPPPLERPDNSFRN